MKKMKKSLIMPLLVAIVFLGAFAAVGLQTAWAVEEHHTPEATQKAPKSAGTQGSGESSGPGGSPPMTGMMGDIGGQSDQGMMGAGGGMMGSGGGMMGMMNPDGGMMGPGMMRMMMSHMMGGPGGMGKMMGQMGGGMMGPGGGAMGSGGTMGPGGGMMKMTRMMESLDLTPEQWASLRALARERLDKMTDLWAQRMKIRFELASVRWDAGKDPKLIKKLFVKGAEAKAEMLLTGLDYLDDVKKILTPEQAAKLESQGFFKADL